MKARGGGEVYSSFSFLTSAIEGSGVINVISRPLFTPGTQCAGESEVPRQSLDPEARGKVFICRGTFLDVMLLILN
jgi:hypothetical protein